MAVAALVLTAVFGGTPVFAASTGWSTVPSPNPSGSLNALSGVSCLTTSSCFAVGDQFHSRWVQTLIERWDGAGWSVVPSVDPGVANSLGGVACVTATFCMAVGGSQESNSMDATLTEAWNGSSWSLVPSPNPPSASSNLINVSCTSASACVAVGWAFNGVTTVGLAERWDGTGWTLMPAANPAPSGKSTTLTGVSCVTATSCFAVGSHAAGPNNRTLDVIERWDGSAWSIVDSPNRYGGPFASNVLAAVWCTNATACLAVGSSSSGGPVVTLVERWDGAAWTIVHSPNRSSNGDWLNGVSCTTTTTCYAVGAAYDSVGATHPMIESWNGTRWDLSSSPYLSGGSILLGVNCVGTRQCTAVGYEQTKREITLVEQRS